MSLQFLTGTFFFPLLHVWKINHLLVYIIIIIFMIVRSLVIRLFSTLILLFNEQLSPALRLQVSSCCTFRIKYLSCYKYSCVLYWIFSCILFVFWSFVTLPFTGRGVVASARTLNLPELNWFELDIFYLLC